MIFEDWQFYLQMLAKFDGITRNGLSTSEMVYSFLDTL
jgi:hypothetical protein